MSRRSSTSARWPGQPADRRFGRAHVRWGRAICAPAHVRWGQNSPNRNPLREGGAIARRQVGPVVTRGATFTMRTYSCRFSRHLSTGKSLTCVSSSFLTGLSSDPSHRSVHSFRPGQGGSDPPQDRRLQTGGNETSPCATSEAGLARIGAIAQAVDKERDHALAVSRSLIRYRHAQIGDGVQEIRGADAGADLAARYRGFKQ